MLIKKLRQACVNAQGISKAEEVAVDLEEYKGGPYDDGTQRFKQTIIFLQQRLRAQRPAKIHPPVGLYQ